MIQEISPHRFDNRFFTHKRIGENDYILNYRENTLLLKNSGDGFELPRKKDFYEITDTTETAFLFTLNDVPCFLILDSLKVDDSCFRYEGIDLFRTTGQREIAWVCIAGYYLINWYSRNQFCGVCGTKTRQKDDERALLCPKCNTAVFPNIAPAIIVAITCGNKILLARGTNFTGNWYSLIAGYVDICETLEETVVREVKEEVGLDIKNIRYYKSQPWPLSGSMMIGFTAEADENQPISIDDKEITQAVWFTRGNLPEYSSSISIAGEMIGKFEQGEL